MVDKLNASDGFSIGTARLCEIDEEWSKIKWNRNHFQIQYHRLYFPTDGRARLRLLKGELELEPGRVYLIPAFSIEQSYIEGKMKKYYIHFQSSSAVFEMYRYLSSRYSVPASESTEYLFRTVLENYSVNSYAARMKVQGAMNLILADFTDELSLDRGSIAKFEPVLSYINEHFREHIELSALSNIMNVSTMYFSNLFKRVFNISPKQFILNKRLTESQRLLLETQMSVKEVAYAVGFENENYFSEYFSAKVGVSALKFRNRDFKGIL